MACFARAFLDSTYLIITAVCSGHLKYLEITIFCHLCCPLGHIFLEKYIFEVNFPFYQDK